MKVPTHNYNIFNIFIAPDVKGRGRNSVIDFKDDAQLYVNKIKNRNEIFKFVLLFCKYITSILGCSDFDFFSHFEV